jgi:hypothetical protein
LGRASLEANGFNHVRSRSAPAYEDIDRRFIALLSLVDRSILRSSRLCGHVGYKVFRDWLRFQRTLRPISPSLAAACRLRVDFGRGRSRKDLTRGRLRGTLSRWRRRALGMIFQTLYYLNLYFVAGLATQPCRPCAGPATSCSLIGLTQVLGVGTVADSRAVGQGSACRDLISTNPLCCRPCGVWR